jgi:hypothetical protein
MESVDLFVIQDQSSESEGRFLMETFRGQPLFGPLSAARTYTTTTAVKNQVTRINGDFNVRYRQARLELKP